MLLKARHQLSGPLPPATCQRPRGFGRGAPPERDMARGAQVATSRGPEALESEPTQLLGRQGHMPSGV